LVVTPASTLHNWTQEIGRFTPSLRVVPYWGSPQDRKTLRLYWKEGSLHTSKSSFHVVVTSYQLATGDAKFFNRCNWQYLILDEAQAIKSSQSQRWRTLLKFKCRNRLLLTGTPVQNGLAELWSLLHFVMPTLFDSHEEFADWFSKDIEAGGADERQLSRLHMILKPFVLRREKKDVEHELSEKVEVLTYCHLTDRQKMLCEKLKKRLTSDGDGSSSRSRKTLMNLFMQFRKVSYSAACIGDAASNEDDVDEHPVATAWRELMLFFRQERKQEHGRRGFVEPDRLERDGDHGSNDARQLMNDLWPFAGVQSSRALRAAEGQVALLLQEVALRAAQEPGLEPAAGLGLGRGAAAVLGGALESARRPE